MSAVVRSSWITGQVIENFAWTDRLLSLRIQADLLPFKAGQFVRLQLPIHTDSGAQLVAKSYSLINAPHEPVLEVFYNLVPKGLLSNALAQLKAGDSIEVSQPANGFFVLDEVPKAAHLWMIATGTGLGPYLSILKTAQAWERFDKIILVHGVPVVKELAYAELIQGFIARYPKQFRFISCVTREANPQGLAGRVTTLLESGELEKTADITISPEQSHIMLCGNHNMLDDMKNLLDKRGLRKHLRHKPGHITTEQYF